jgi:GDPmannose 4,6-dehydratase
MKKILITGITGQDGIFLTNLLQKKGGYQILGVSRNPYSIKKITKSLQYLNNGKLNINNIDIVSTNLLIEDEVFSLLQDYKPDYIYNLTGPSSVYESILNPKLKIKIENIFDNLTSSLIKEKNFCNFYQASSSEMYKSSTNALTENSPFLPNSPYAEAKLKNHIEVLNLRQKYDWNIYSGITFNHESEFRKDNYLFMKIINSAISITKNSSSNLTIGSIDYVRDWSYSADVSEAIYNICEHGKNPTYVIGSGEGKKISDILKIVFSYFDLNWTDFTKINPEILRSGDPKSIIANPNLVRSEFGWNNQVSFEQMIEKCIRYKIKDFKD